LKLYYIRLVLSSILTIISKSQPSDATVPKTLNDHTNKRLLVTSNTETMPMATDDNIQPLVNTPKKMTVVSRCLITALIATIQFSNGLQLSMVASRAPFGRHQTQSNGATRNSNSTRKKPAANNKSSSSVTSTFISQLACMALKRRLEDHTHVSCDLTADSNNLLLGRVGPVTVKGRGWESPLGLTCRAIEATVDECKLDMGRVISNQKLVLTTPAEGRAMVALSARDFGNFITHPLIKPPSPPINIEKYDGALMSESGITFEKENVSVNPSTGTVQFYGTYGGSKWKYTLERASDGLQKAKIHAELAEDYGNTDFLNNKSVHELEERLAMTTSQFFNEMVFDLDGTFLSFEDMMLTEKGKEASVMLSLRITVEKFPSPGIEF